MQPMHDCEVDAWKDKSFNEGSIAQTRLEYLVKFREGLKESFLRGAAGAKEEEEESSSSELEDDVQPELTPAAISSEEIAPSPEM